MYQVTREFKFDSAHYLSGYKGDCGNLHGHTWKVAVTFEGEFLDELGMLIDFKRLKVIIGELVVARFDHKLLNDVIPINPTAENLARIIYDTVAIAFEDYIASGINLANVRVYENYPECYVDYFR